MEVSLTSPVEGSLTSPLKSSLLAMSLSPTLSHPEAHPVASCAMVRLSSPLPSWWSTRPSSGPAAFHMPSSHRPCCASCSTNPFLFLLSCLSRCRAIDASLSGGGPKFLWMIVLEPFHTPDLLLDFQRPENEVRPWDLPYFLCSCHWCQIPARVESLPLLKLFSFLCLSLFFFFWMYILTLFRLNVTLYSSSGFPFDVVCCCSITQSCPTLCNPMDCGMLGFLVLHYPCFDVIKVLLKIQPCFPYRG